MADNLTTQSSTPATIPASSVIATDDVGGVHFQKVKIDVGGDGASAVLGNANPLPVSDAGGNISIDDGGNSITVDGTVAVSGTVTVGSHAVTNAGTFATQVDGAALTALQLIDNIVLAEDAAHGSGDPGVQLLAVQKTTGAALAGTDGDYTPLQTDSSGNLRVNVAAGGAGDGAILDGVSSSIKATVLDYTNSNPLAVRLSDTNGDYVGAGAGTQYTEDAAAAADPVGTALNLIRKDTPASEVSLDGDNIAARGNSAGAQYVELLSGTAKIGGDATNGLKVDITRIAAGTNNIGDVDVLSIAAGDNNIGNVDVVTMPNVTVGTMANLTESLVDDAAFTPATSRVVPVGFEFDDTAPDSVNEGDIGAARMSANRNQYMTIRDAAGNERGVNVDASNRLSVSVDNIAASQTIATVTTVSTLTGGGVAHDGADSGNPVKVGAKASATLSDDTMVANADRIDLTGDLDGALYVRQVPLGDIIFEAVSDTAGNSTAFTNFGATASTRSYITSITAFRTDAGTSMAYIDFRDGTAGSVIYRVPLPPTGGVTINSGGTPLFYTTANTALAYDVSGALTTVYISVTGFKSKARA